MSPRFISALFAAVVTAMAAATALAFPVPIPAPPGPPAGAPATGVPAAAQPATTADTNPATLQRPPLVEEQPGATTASPPPPPPVPPASAGNTNVASPPPPPPPQAHDDGQAADLVPLIDEERPRSRLNTAAWVGVGVTTVLLGVAAYFGASAAEKSGDANRLLTYSDPKTGLPQEYASRAAQFEDDVRDGRRDDRLAKGFLIGAAVTALASTVMFVVDGFSSPDKAPGPARSPTALRARPALSGAPARGTATPTVGLIWSF